MYEEDKIRTEELVAKNYRIIPFFIVCFISSFVLFTGTILVLRALQINVTLTIFIAFTLFFSGLIFCLKVMKKYFIRKAIFHFSIEYFSIQIFNKNNSLVYSKTFYWSELQSFKVYPVTNEYTYLDLVTNDNKMKEYHFIEDNFNFDNFECKKVDESLLNIMSLFIKYTKNYNKSISQNNDTVKYWKGSMSNIIAKIMIVFFLLIILVGSFLSFRMHEPKFLIFVVNAFFILLGIFIKRKRDEKIAEEFNKLIAATQ